MSGSIADAAAAGPKPKPKANNKRAAKDAPPALEPAAKSAKRDPGASAGAPAAPAQAAPAAPAPAAARVPDKYNLAVQPALHINDWKLNNFEVFGHLCAGGTKRAHELRIRTPPALVRAACLEGLGEKGYQEERDTDKNKLTLELVFGDLPESITAKHPNLLQEHQHFIQYVKDLVEGIKDIFLDDSKVRPGVAKKIKADAKAEGLVGAALKAEVRERFFHDLKEHFTFFEQDGKPMMTLPLEQKAMRINKEDADPRMVQQPGPDVVEPLYTYLKLVGPYAPCVQNKVRYFNLKSERMFEGELENDPYFKVVRRGSICAVDFNLCAYSHDPKDNGDPDYWAIKAKLCQDMVRVFPEDETDDFKRESERILDLFDNPAPEVDEYADAW